MKTLTKKTVQIDYHKTQSLAHTRCYASLSRRRYQYAVPVARISVPIGGWPSRAMLVSALLDLVMHLESGEGLPPYLLDQAAPVTAEESGR